MKHCVYPAAIVLIFSFLAFSQDSLDYLDCEIYGLSAYQADYVSGLPESSPSGMINIEIGRMDKPIVLVCTGYDPMIWKVSNPYNVEIRLVILNGWNAQIIQGVEDSVPVISRERSTHHSPEISTSQYSDYHYLEEYVKSITGKGFTTFQNAYNCMYFFVREPNSIPYDSCELYSVYTSQGAGASPAYKYHPRGSVMVEIGPMPKPIVLLLGAYEPVEWHINNTGQAIIKAVFVDGYYQGKVTNIADSVTLYSSDGGSGIAVFTGLSVKASQSAQATGYFFIEHVGAGIKSFIFPLPLNSSIKVFPNPFHGVISIDCGGLPQIPKQMDMFNSAGKKIGTIALKRGRRNSWEGKDLPNGTYTMCGRIGDKQISKKLVLIK